MFVSEIMNGYGPLHDVKVVELAEWVAAPAAVRCLGEWGAEVIKVENPAEDPQRSQCYGFGGQNTETCDPTYENVNANKDWISLNLKTEEGMAIFMDLLSDADVFVNGLRDKALVKMGLDYETLHEKFPRLIWAQMRGYGQYGAMRNEPGYDAVCWGSRGGVNATFRQAGESPAIAPQGFGDFNAAAIFAGGIVAALFNRERTGVGEKVTTNLYHVALWGHSHGIQSHQFGATYPCDRAAVRNPFNNTYQSRDGVWFLICLPDYNRYYNPMMKMLGLDEMVDDPRMSTLAAIRENNLQEFVVSQMEQGYAQKNYDEWDEVMMKQEVPHQKLFDYADILADEEAYDNDALRRYESKDFGPRVFNTTPIRFDSYDDPPLILGKPCGYHTERYLLSKGYTPEQIAALEEKGAVRCWHGEDLDTIPVLISKRQAQGEAPCNW